MERKPEIVNLFIPHDKIVKINKIEEKKMQSMGVEKMT